MGSSLSAPPRKLRKAVDSLAQCSEDAVDIDVAESRVASIIELENRYPQYLVSSDVAHGLFVKLAQLGSIEALENALCLAKCAPSLG